MLRQFFINDNFASCRSSFHNTFSQFLLFPKTWISLWNIVEFSFREGNLAWDLWGNKWKKVLEFDFNRCDSEPCRCEQHFETKPLQLICDGRCAMLLIFFFIKSLLFVWTNTELNIAVLCMLLATAWFAITPNVLVSPSFEGPLEFWRDVRSRQLIGRMPNREGPTS